MLLEKDIQQITNKGITKEMVNAQISRIKNGMTYSNLKSAATIGRGIKLYKTEEIQGFIDVYKSKKNELDIVKFVPASGAATRMFKFLYLFLNQFNPQKDTIEEFVKQQGNDFVKKFTSQLKDFPFYEDVLLKTKEICFNLDSLTDNEACFEFVKTMLNPEGLNYGFLPKGTFPFHKYSSGIKTPFYEHLIESTLYASSKGEAKLHFTISKKHYNNFKAELNKYKDALEKQTNTRFNVSYSYQDEITETVALTIDNKVFRNEDGSILFRPAGHGALLTNLNRLNSDIVFIKNVDNVVVLDLNKKLVKYKKLLGGVLLKIQEQVFSFLHELDDTLISEKKLLEIVLFLSSELNVVIDEDFDDFSLQEKQTYLKSILNRPLRVCGMVKNQGEPGGGPFWVKNRKGNTSLQIVEFAQIDISNKLQEAIVQNATHFNPVDLVCGIKNYKGEKFDLQD